MSEKNAAETVQGDDFVLKHRMAGAAFLLFFGALILPWLLGPSDKVKNSESEKPLQTTLSNNEQINAQIIEQELAKDLQAEDAYVSKITPLNESASESVVEKEGGDKQSEVPQPVIANTQPEPNNAKPEPERQPEQEKKKTAPVVKKVAPVAKKSKPVVKKPKQKKEVTVGWIVSVGVFSQQGNVDEILKDLKSKGFDAKTSPMDTNKGKATRVWLGPFEQRVQAAKVKTRLKQKTGESGFLKVYP